ncbi:TonB family protein [Simiduia sp. 21SJ11W-1]|uniref:energy transducer TonB n=1 Tax=Simiduia sp. 21SJ11W-1 TaxID=2909669 RepID=UPI0020A1BDB3|nr:energy transducer TonB [Simiduia sp. 21SJ11W-1]UTA48243.1 TonB family protein [Simiduia sp. 21SJ11W-1]
MNTAAFARPEFRFASALPSAALTTIALIYGMHVLIDRDYTEPDAIPDLPVINVVMDDPGPVEVLYEQATKPQEPEPLPATPEFEPHAGDMEVAGLLPGFSKPVITDHIPGIDLGGGNLVKQVMIAPNYPRRALARGIEGFVDVAYDVTAYGTTTNLQVLRAEPEGVFEKAALAAVAKWKFRPQMIDNEPVPTQGLRERVRFSIEQ